MVLYRDSIQRLVIMVGSVLNFEGSNSRGLVVCKMVWIGCRGEKGMGWIRVFPNY